MKILIQQTLHGYQNGHQLLNSSLELTPDEKKILLFQSDLSGSSLVNGFSTYFTGYPIDGSRYYAFARTWYAAEMKRPGCVWTHTLLINLADLGKIPELFILNDLFNRPILDQYKKFEEPLEFENNAQNIFETEINLGIKAKISSSLYNSGEEAILLPSQTADKFESIILSIWSDQWPRMRRNFTFCSGALSLKTLDEKVFDLQVIPASRINSFERQSAKTTFLYFESSEDTLKMEGTIYSKNNLRKFLWTYGSEIEGQRKNFLPLLELYDVLNNGKLSLPLIVNKINKNFPNKKQGKSFKTKLFSEDSILIPRITEKELLFFLITNKDLNFLSIADLEIEKRLKEIIKRKEIDIFEFLELWTNAQEGRLTSKVWDIIDISINEITSVLKTDESLTELLLEKNPKFSEHIELWQLNHELQIKILDILNNLPVILNWERITAAILTAESHIILDLVLKKGNLVVIYSLEWLNDSSNKLCLISIWSQKIIVEYYGVFYKWSNQNKKQLNPKIFALIFIYCTPNQIVEYNFSGEIWITGYQNLQKNNYCVNLLYLSSLLLGLSLNRKLADSELIISEIFHDVYSYSANSKLDNGMWTLIPKDQIEDDENDDIGILENLFSFLGFGKPKKGHEIEDWDYCELLIRSLVSKFIKYDWSSQYFFNTLKNKSAFMRAVNYSLSLKKGKKFMKKLIHEKQIGKAKPLAFQSEVLSSII